MQGSWTPVKKFPSRTIGLEGEEILCPLVTSESPIATMPPKQRKEVVDEDVYTSSSSGNDDSASDSEQEVPQKRQPQPVLEKDSDEEELERLVLGDSSNFRENLFKNDHSSITPSLCYSDLHLIKADKTKRSPIVTSFAHIYQTTLQTCLTSLSNLCPFPRDPASTLARQYQTWTLRTSPVR